MEIEEKLKQNNVQYIEESNYFIAACPFRTDSDGMAMHIQKETGKCECWMCKRICSFAEFLKMIGEENNIESVSAKNENPNPAEKTHEPKFRKRKKENKESANYIASKILPDGRMVEMVYKEQYPETQLAIYNGEKITYETELKLPYEVLMPYPASNPLVSKKVILFPSEAEEYGSDNELVGKIKQFIHKYLDINPLFEKIATYYAMFTWVYDQFNELAYLRALGDYGSGKSRLLQVIGSICYKPMFVGGATTTSPIFRIIDSFNGTLILDEADYRFSDTTVEIIKILNSGYQKGSQILRCSEGQGKYEVKAYDVFCPKIIATRKRFYDQALESRFLVEEMDKKELRDDIPYNLPDSFEAEALQLRNQLLMWRFKNVKKAGLKPEDIDRALEPRLNQIMMPLLSIIDDPLMKKELKDFIRGYNEQLVADRGMSLDSEIFEALLRCFQNGYAEPTIKQVADTYGAELTDKEKLNPRKVGSILRQQLKLKAKRTKGGYVIAESENKASIAALKRKYGILEDGAVEPVNEVNVVNVVNVAGEGISKENKEENGASQRFNTTQEL